MMELPIFTRMKEILPRTEPIVILEIGCHRGEDTLQLLDYFPKAQIYAFEPDPRNIAYIKSHGLDRKFHFIESAVGRFDGTTTFYLSSGKREADAIEPWTLSSSLHKPKVHLERVPWCKFEEQVQVPIFTLDTFAKQHGLHKIDFIWMDVQGAEEDVIQGGLQILQKTRYIYTEYSDVEMYEDQINLDTILERLPGTWQIAEQYAYDFVVLLENKRLLRPPSFRSRLKTLISRWKDSRGS